MEGELRKVEGDMRAQIEAQQAASHRVKEDNEQLHRSYLDTLTKLVSGHVRVIILLVQKSLQ